MRDGNGRWGRVLLLGGASEIGLAVLHALDLQSGAEVLLAGRDVEALAAVTLPAGVQRICLAWDATDRASAVALVEHIMATGDLDLVIAAAGVLGLEAASDADRAQEVLAINFVGLVGVLVPLAEALRLQRHGTIVVLSSVAGLRARKSNYLYGASKAGLDAFASGLGDRLAPDGVRVLVVRPGFVRGRMTEGLTAAPFATTPEAVGRVVRRALDRGSDVVWAPPVLRLVAPVLHFIPRTIWRRLEL